MLFVTFPTTSSTTMKEAVIPSIPNSRGAEPHPLQLNDFGNFILTLSRMTFLGVTLL